MLRPCLECGELSEDSRCPKHKLQKGNKRERGYDHRWDMLVKKAKKLQPFCADCGATENLTGDHSPEAWRRHNAGLRIRLQDIDIVCGPCNRARGAARGPGGAPLQRPKRPRPPGLDAI